VLERLFMGERVGYWLEWQGLRLYCEGSEGTWQEGQELSLHLELSRAIPLEGA
jgi:putative spermidine/putrescine transport system ATP-binding protein